MKRSYIRNSRRAGSPVGTRTQVRGHPTRQLEHLLRFRQQGVEKVDFDGG